MARTMANTKSFNPSEALAVAAVYIVIFGSLYVLVGC